MTHLEAAFACSSADFGSFWYFSFSVNLVGTSSPFLVAGRPSIVSAHLDSAGNSETSTPAQNWSDQYDHSTRRG